MIAKRLEIRLFVCVFVTKQFCKWIVYSDFGTKEVRSNIGVFGYEGLGDLLGKIVCLSSCVCVLIGQVLCKEIMIYNSFDTIVCNVMV